MNFQHFRGLADLLWRKSFSKNNSLTAYKFIKIRKFLIGSDLGSDIDRCEDENNPIMKHESLFPFVASLRQPTSLCFLFPY